LKVNFEKMLNSFEFSVESSVRFVTVIPDIPHDAIWELNAQTVAGGFGLGSTFDRLHCPKGLYVDGNQTIFVADNSNHRIMKYTQGAIIGRNITCKNISGHGLRGLRAPLNVVFDKCSRGLIIADYHNRRVLRWFRRNHAEILIKNVACGGLTIDDENFLYLSDTEKHEVRRYGADDRHGTVVAGGRGQGSRLNQLNHPTYVFVGPDEGVYVSDTWNDRVVKWDKGASEGVIVAGGKGKGQARTQLDCPSGLVVDQFGTVYVVDHWNHRVMRWYKGASRGEIIAGGKHIAGDGANQLNEPEGLAFDLYGNLYVADSNNHRIQRFNVQTA
jgi:sugar lactone lactonase YvrE